MVPRNTQLRSDMFILCTKLRGMGFWAWSKRAENKYSWVAKVHRTASHVRVQSRIVVHRRWRNIITAHSRPHERGWSMLPPQQLNILQYLTCPFGYTEVCVECKTFHTQCFLLIDRFEDIWYHVVYFYYWPYGLHPRFVSTTAFGVFILYRSLLFFCFTCCGHLI